MHKIPLSTVYIKFNAVHKIIKHVIKLLNMSLRML